VHPADHGKAIAMRANALAAPQTYSCELRLRRHDGRYVWFLNRAVPELQADGTVECWIGSLTDISQQKDAELELRASEQRLRLGLGVARVAISEIDYIEEVHRLSAEMAALFGFGEEAVTLPREVVRHRLHPEDRELLDARNAATLLEGAPAWFELDHRLLLPDGKTRCIRIRKLNLIEGQGAHKRKTGSIMAAFDITDSKAAEAALKQTAEMLRLGVGVARLGLLDIDYGASSIHLSDEAARMYGLGEEATTVPAEVVHRRTHPDDLVELIRRSDALTPARSNWLEIEYRILLPQGGTRWVRAWKTVQFDGEGPTARAVRAIVAFLDVTDGRRAEQGAREAARRFRELAGGIAHDFNNLLTSVLLHASLAERAAKEPEVKRSLQTILQAAQTAAGITSGLVTLSERPTPPTEAVDINQRVKRVVQLSEPTLRPDVEVVLQLAEGEVRVLMNAAQCDQIVLNLVINAREAMPSGGRLTIATAVIERPGIGTTEPARCARLTVADTGPGMPAEAMQHIFEPYFTTKRNSGGRGLGLAILDAIVTNHGGKVSVQSTAVTGTCFEVLLPCLESAAPDSAPASETGTEPVSHGLRTILLAEDDEKIRDVLQQLLSRQGFYVLACADGQHALELAEGLQGKIDLLISDIRMPRMDGVSLAHTLVQTRPDLKVLLISGHLGDSNISLQAVRPEWTLLRKPFQLQDFLQKIVGLMNASAIGPESSPSIDS
jgi:signal transduction histidine kinase/ActR/RegA family two-component response regulator